MEIPVALAAVQWDSPLLWALVIGWVLSVTVHEFAHGLAGHIGGDYTVRERGGLTLNPLQYIDPVMSLIVPAIILVIGGVPLPGGVTYIREDLLRGRAWRTAVALAGPASNFLLFLLLLVLLHPALGIFDVSRPISEWSNGQVFVAALASLQMIAAILNLLPVPPLDGFNAIAPYLPEGLVARMRTPAVNLLCLALIFLVVARLPIVVMAYGYPMVAIPMLLGMPPETGRRLIESFQMVLWGA